MLDGAAPEPSRPTLLVRFPWSEGVPPAGFEPATGGLEVHCSIQLSYRGWLQTIVADQAVPFGVRSGSGRRGHGWLRLLPVILSAGLTLAVSVGCGRGSETPAPSAGSSSPSSDAALRSGATEDGPFAFRGLTTTPPPATVVPTQTAPPGDLAAVTSITPLEGFMEIPGGPGLGPLDLASASGGDPREREALMRFGFRGGFRRGFAKGREEMIVTVMRFSSPADADAYLRDTVESALVGNGSFPFALGVSGGTGYREQGAGEDGEPYVTYGALFTRGDRGFEQLVRSPAAGPERGEVDAQAMARQQADRVGG